jgi:type IV secretion system protein VirB6
MAINIAQTMYDAVDAALQSTLTTGMTKVMLVLGALFGTFWLLSFTLRGIHWLYMGMTAIFQEVVFEIGKMAFFASCAFNIQWYVQTIVPFVTGGAAWMGGILSGQEGSQINQIDTMIITYVGMLGKLISAMKFNLFTNSVADIYLGIQAVIIYLLGGVPFLLVAVGTSLILKVSTTVMLVVGPVFIAFALFEKTRQWFWGWICIVGGFMLTHVLFSIVLALELSFINTFIIKDGVIDVSLYGNFVMLICFAVFTMIATELPGYAASVMGGAPTGTAGIGGIIGKATGVSTAMRAANGLSRMARTARELGNRNKIT